MEHKIILDKKIQQNNIDIEKYEYSKYDKAYKRFEKGQYDGVIRKIELDKKGYLTEKIIGEGPNCDLDDITVYDGEGNKFHFNTMDRAYDYECKNGNLYYVGYLEADDENVYGAVYQPESKSDDRASQILIKDLYKEPYIDTFEEKKTEVLKEFIDTNEKTVVQNFLATKSGTREDIASAYEQTKAAFADILPTENAYTELEDSIDLENLFS